MALRLTDIGGNPSDIVVRGWWRSAGSLYIVLLLYWTVACWTRGRLRHFILVPSRPQHCPLNKDSTLTHRMAHRAPASLSRSWYVPARYETQVYTEIQ